jgi:hypothetical protein
METERKVCVCGDCGRKFFKGDEGDNEEYCLRCCHIDLIREMGEDEWEDFDRSRSEE